MIALLFNIIAFIIAITVHEFAHAYVSDRLGDPTARLMGRLTLNPKHHIDTLGTIIIPLFLALSGSNFIIGWAKPVPFDPYNLRNPRRDSALISLAGPASNLIVAFACSLVLQAIFHFRLPVVSQSFLGLTTYVLSLLLNPVIIINVVLAIFNLIPIHPLDGFKIVGGILPHEYAKQWYELERYGMIFLIFMIFPLFGTSPINNLISPVINALLNILLPAVPFI
ncbi:site-2 protease family protein [Patescibacteria group bacterium]|nr:site-2 protease family protein [Patescibacteria group bacterium]MBU1472613.1 site-2 protease family protein [Patescibacteria group bacterium]MBU2459864.1 site-2 protease family protein [Patescibacteria group bacterium]MBU2544075.1 site-2 protease family protein [Patescibacteria group bacterium]